MPTAVCSLRLRTGGRGEEEGGGRDARLTKKSRDLYLASGEKSLYYIYVYTHIKENNKKTYSTHNIYISYYFMTIFVPLFVIGFASEFGINEDN